MRRILIVVFLLSFIPLLPNSPTPTEAATVINVTTTADELNINSQCSLREAVFMAWGNDIVDCGGMGTSPFTINIPAGTYTVDSEIEIFGGIQIDFVGADQATTIIQAHTNSPTGSNRHSIFVIASGGNTVSFQDLTLRHGEYEFGGAVASGISSNSLRFERVTVTNNRANNPDGLGGAVYVGTSSNLTIIDSTFSHNTADSQGGAIQIDGESTLTITGSVFDTNYSGGDGGAILTTGSILANIDSTTFTNNGCAGSGGSLRLAFISPLSTISNSTFTNGFAANGGSIYAETSTLSIDKSSFENTLHFGNHGGTLYNNGGAITISESTFHRNEGAGLPSPVGIAIYNSGILNLFNSTISENFGGSSAGGIYNDVNGNVVSINNTFYRNRGDVAGSIVSVSAANTIEMRNTAILDNFGLSDNCSLGTSLLDSGYNISSDNTCGFGDTNNMGVGDGIDPFLNPLANNGGPTETHSYRPGSQLTDGSGEPCLIEVAGVDQRGEPRDSYCDIGAYESQLTTPANNWLTNAESVTAGVPITATPFNATLSTTDPDLWCVNNVTNTIWYAYTATTAEQLSAEFTSVNFNPVVGIVTGTEGNFTMLACSTTKAYTSTSVGETYYIVIGNNNITPVNGAAEFTLDLNTSASNAALILFDPLTADTNFHNQVLNFPSVTEFTNIPPTNTASVWVMGDWNGDGVKTPGYFDSGAFRYTNDIGPSTNWSAGFFLGNPPSLFGVVAGRFSAGFANDTGNDCIGWIDSNTNGAGDLRFSLKYWCDMTTTPQSIGGILTPQWLAAVLSDSQGFVGTHQWVYGDWDNDGLDEPGVRRGEFITRSTNAPSEGAALYGAGMAQRWAGIGGATGPGGHGLDDGVFVAGDWNGDGTDTWGVVYDDDTFYYRDVFGFNPGPFEFAAQTFTSSIATPRQVDSHHNASSGSSSPAPAFADVLRGLETDAEAINSADVDTSRNIEADLSISKTGNYTLGEVGLVGDSIVWTITVSNTGTAPANGVQITDNVPAELRVDDALADNGTISVRGQSVTFTAESIGVGETLQFQVVTTILSQPVSGSFANSVNVLVPDGDGGGSDANLVASGTVENVDGLPATGYAPRFRW